MVFGIFFVGGPWATGLAMRLRGDLARTNALLMRRAGGGDPAGGRRGARDHRPRAARRGRARDLGDRAPVPRGAPELGRDEEQVRRALDAIEHTNTQALGDMRRLLAVLRDTEGDAATTPQPSLARLDDLVADVRESGLAVELVEVGEDRDVPPGVDLSAYRIVQEALTNVLKHAAAGARDGPAGLRRRRADAVGPRRRRRRRGLERHRARAGRDPRAGRGRRRRDRDRPGRRRRLRGQRPAPLLRGGLTWRSAWSSPTTSRWCGPGCG